MTARIRREDHSVLAQLYDSYRRTYPQSRESIQRELESAYRELFGEQLESAEKIATVVNGIFDEHAGYAHEHGIYTGVRLALDLELEDMMYGAPDTSRTWQEDFSDHASDPKTEGLIAYVQATHPDIILIVPETPADVAQEELPY